MKEALYYRKEGGKCRCLLCPRECLIPDGETGFCRARAADGGNLYAVSYGAASSLALDPIEKKPLYRFHPGSSILSYGSYGCNMRCPWCQNSSISQCGTPQGAVRLTPDMLVQQAIGEATARGAVSRATSSRQVLGLPALDRQVSGRHASNRQVSNQHSNIGIAFTYNEPLIAPEFIIGTAPLLHAAGLCAVLVTNGFVNEEPFADILPHIDAMNIDLKGFSEIFYKNCGARLETVKSNIKSAANDPHCHIEVTTLVIPGENDSDEMMRAEAEWLAGIDPHIPLHITRFFPRWKMDSAEPTPRETIDRLATVAREYLQFVY